LDYHLSGQVPGDVEVEEEKSEDKDKKCGNENAGCEGNEKVDDAIKKLEEAKKDVKKAKDCLQEELNKQAELLAEDRLYANDKELPKEVRRIYQNSVKQIEEKIKCLNAQMAALSGSAADSDKLRNINEILAQKRGALNQMLREAMLGAMLKWGGELMRMPVEMTSKNLRKMTPKELKKNIRDLESQIKNLEKQREKIKKDKDKLCEEPPKECEGFDCGVQEAVKKLAQANNALNCAKKNKRTAMRRASECTSKDPGSLYNPCVKKNVDLNYKYYFQYIDDGQMFSQSKVKGNKNKKGNSDSGNSGEASHRETDYNWLDRGDVQIVTANVELIDTVIKPKTNSKHTQQITGAAAVMEQTGQGILVDPKIDSSSGNGGDDSVSSNDGKTQVNPNPTDSNPLPEGNQRQEKQKGSVEVIGGTWVHPRAVNNINNILKPGEIKLKIARINNAINQLKKRIDEAKERGLPSECKSAITDSELEEYKSMFKTAGEGGLSIDQINKLRKEVKSDKGACAGAILKMAGLGQQLKQLQSKLENFKKQQKQANELVKSGEESKNKREVKKKSKKKGKEKKEYPAVTTGLPVKAYMQFNYLSRTRDIFDFLGLGENLFYLPELFTNMTMQVMSTAEINSMIDKAEEKFIEELKNHEACLRIQAQWTEEEINKTGKFDLSNLKTNAQLNNCPPLVSGLGERDLNRIKNALESVKKQLEQAKKNREERNKGTEEQVDKMLCGGKDKRGKKKEGWLEKMDKEIFNKGLEFDKTLDKLQKQQDVIDENLKGLKAKIDSLRDHAIAHYMFDIQAEGTTKTKIGEEYGKAIGFYEKAERYAGEARNLIAKEKIKSLSKPTLMGECGKIGEGKKDPLNKIKSKISKVDDILSDFYEARKLALEADY
ncbi:hypothetical protein DRJ25_06190, partial [Candidatus Woesearchaeota archaeon]